MTNNLKNFLERDTEDFCGSLKLPDSWLKNHDKKVVNTVLDLVEKEVEKPEVASGVMLDQRGRKWVELKDLKTIINNLRV